MMVKYGVKDVVKWINIFPQKGRVSKKYITGEILTAKSVEYKKYYKMSFGSYW